MNQIKLPIMRFCVLLLLLTISSAIIKAQDYTNREFEEVIQFPIPVMKAPKFKGGKKGLDQYLKDHVVLPDSLSSINTEGVLVMNYRVGTKNKILDVKVDEKNSTLNSRLHSTITNVLLRSGPWQHGTNNGKPMITLLQISYRFDN